MTDRATMSAVRATLFAAVGTVGCAQHPTPPDSETAQTQHSEYPQLRLHVVDTAADEGASWDIVVHRDASFRQAFTSSNGARDIVERCRGTLVATEVEAWFSRVAPAATLLTAPAHPKRKWDGTDPPHFFTVAHASDQSTVRYADTGAWATELPAWFEQMRTCTK